MTKPHYQSVGSNEQIYNDSSSYFMPVDRSTYLSQYNFPVTPSKGDQLNLSLNKMKRVKKGYELNSFMYFNSHPDRHWDRAQQMVENSARNEEYDHDSETVFKVFFSDENVDVIQKMIILEVFERSNKKFLIPKQKREQIIIVAQYIYKTHAQNLPYQIKEQVRRLNKILVNEIVPDILTNLDQYVGYLDTINNPIRPIDRPINVSSKGTRTLPSVTRIISED